MKLGALGDSLDFFHNSRRNLLTVALLAVTAYECAELIIEDDPLRLYSAGLVVLGTVALLAILKNWRVGVYCFVAWIAVEDLIRKYLGNNMTVYFVKDFCALVLYLSFFFNSVLILLVAGFGIAQSILGHTFLNPEVIQEDIRGLSTLYRVSPITGLVAYRPTSFFVSAGRFQNFLVLSWVLALGFGGLLLMRKQNGRLLAFTSVGIVAAASLMAASSGLLQAPWSLALPSPGVHPGPGSSESA